jgi:hypothetical protein
MLVGWSVRWLVGLSVHPSVCPHDEILQNLLMSKTGYVAIVSHLVLGNHLVYIIRYFIQVIFENLVKVLFLKSFCEHLRGVC